MPTIKKPREKLAAFGVDNLSNWELFAIILGFGTAKISVVDLSQKISKFFEGNKNETITIKTLREELGLAQGQATKVIATLELGKRYAIKNTLPKIDSPIEALHYLQDIASKNKEYFVALYLNARHEMVNKQTISIGNINQNYIQAREVFAPAFQTPCMGIILAHNHPSGDPTPSEDDITLTKNLAEAGELLGIEILDHLIVSKNDYRSIKELGLL